MLIAVVALVVGVAVLAVAADQFVLAAARVALIRNVSALVVGVVIVGFGTSAPELLVSALAAWRDEPAIAVGNVVGSNIVNLSLILGLGAIVVPLVVDSRTVKLEAPITLAAAAGFGVAVQGGGVSRAEGMVLVVAMAAAVIVIVRRAGPDPLGTEVDELAQVATHRLGVETVRMIAGLAGTLAAAQVLLWGATEVADRAGLSQGFVGATLVAVGTSLPELVTVLQSARRRETDLIVGNLLGSNLFNALVVGGTIGLIGGPGVGDSSLTGFGAIAAIGVAAVALAVMVTGHTVTRREGVLLCLTYGCLVPFLA
ncbi:MAG: sodium:calcium antiporter [Acidimicrobiia bacterium]